MFEKLARCLSTAIRYISHFKQDGMKKIFNGVLHKVDSLFEEDLSTSNRSVPFKVATATLLAGSISCVIYVLYSLTRNWLIMPSRRSYVRKNQLLLLISVMVLLLVVLLGQFVLL